ncbi:MAG: aromatic ring-hydroxylating dioxygenase subunit alpha, partial [Cyanobacteria bacterium]|nr:aromatic ring-hydroxylating dioxygenase subunit alpha [Cyanobacteriota bacterium]MDW8202287.1 aromatic ring-hydroxylating dioxygenase subunit alpha [Cyanobacteriota bacterium SKYGB_h_bin112]
TQQPVLRRFWYPVVPMSELSFDRPYAIKLLGEHLVLWLDADGQPAAALDRCCHRSAQLSKGSIVNGCVQCPYHGWQFDRHGTCVGVPQLEPYQAIPASYRIPAYQCTPRYGYAWVCLDDRPLQPIPTIPEAEDPNLRFIHQFYERWNCSGLRIMENSFDNAHFSFVHYASFGDQHQPRPASLQVSSVDHGLTVKTVVDVVNPPLQQKNLRLAEATTVRTMHSNWYLPFIRTLKITYPNGVMHMLFTAATPIDDRSSQVLQFCVRNDTEADASTEDIIAFDRQVTLEDRAVLETTDYDAPLDTSVEQHMASDRVGIMMRHRLTALLKEHGEVEIRRSGAM